jgi:hypothetical protein
MTDRLRHLLVLFGLLIGMICLRPVPAAAHAITCHTKAYQPQLSSLVGPNPTITGFGEADCSRPATSLRIDVCIEYRMTSLDEWRDLDCAPDTAVSGDYTSARAEGPCLIGRYRYRTVSLSYKTSDGQASTKRKVSQGLTVECSPEGVDFCSRVPQLCITAGEPAESPTALGDDYNEVDAAIDGTIDAANNTRNQQTEPLGHAIYDLLG